jgi:hypothetical protein
MCGLRTTNGIWLLLMRRSRLPLGVREEAENEGTQVGVHSSCLTHGAHYLRGVFRPGELAWGSRSQSAPKVTEGQYKPSGDKPEGEAARQQSTTGQPGVKVEGDVRDYYRAAAAGDYDYTYEHLTDLDQMAFTRSEWAQANTTLQSEQGTYEITAVRKVSDGEYDVDLLVRGTPRTTRFVYATEAGAYKHELTGEEIVMFTDALSLAPLPQLVIQ